MDLTHNTIQKEVQNAAIRSITKMMSAPTNVIKGVLTDEHTTEKVNVGVFHQTPFEIMSHGMKLRFIDDAPPTSRWHHNNIPDEYLSTVGEFVESLNKREIISQVPKHYLKYIMGIKVRFKNDRKIRLIINRSKLSDRLKKYEMKMPKHVHVANAAQNFNYACVIDIKDMYYNIPIAEEDKKYLGICFGGKYYAFNMAPMGISTSCEACAHITNNIANEVHHSTLVQLDDFLVGGRTEEECIDRRDQLILLLTKHGFPINFEKSKLIPARHVEFLQYHLNLENHCMYTKTEKFGESKCSGSKNAIGCS